MRPRQQVVAITGASSGFGRATARHFAQRGWSVGLIARSDAGLEETRRDVVRADGKAVARSPDAKRLRDPNLFAPTDRVHDARGPWTAFERSAQLWATENRSWVAAGLGLGVLAAVATTVGRANSS